MDLTASLYDALADDATLSAQLATYAGGPAIFSGDLPPGDFSIGGDPCLLIRPPTDEINRDTFSSFARSVTIDLFLYATAGMSAGSIDDAAARVRVLLHRQYLPSPASGAAQPFCTVSGPFGAPASEPSIAARRLSARLDFRE
jgi:hypothetical protein